MAILENADSADLQEILALVKENLSQINKSELGQSIINTVIQKHGNNVNPTDFSTF